MLSNATKEAREGNLDIRQQARKIGNVFLNHVELSAQEAVYTLLQLHLRQSSRTVIFINTSIKENRVIFLKSQADLEEMADEDTDVECDNASKRYLRRPVQLEDTCLADFIAWYSTAPAGQNSQRNLLRLTTGEKLRKRRKQAVIRYVRFCKEKDSENYYREVLMLFHPWRIEEEIIGTCDSYGERYIEVCQLGSNMQTKMDEYNHCSHEIEEAENEMRRRRKNR